jgi:hypothetical protein
MAVRDAVEHFDREGVLLDPVDWSLEEHSADLLNGARWATDQAEGRLPNLRLRLGAASGGAISSGQAVEKLRGALTHLRNYIGQPGEGEDWSHAELTAAKDSLDEARELEQRFLAAVA